MVGMTAIPAGSNPDLSFQIRGGTASKEVHADNAPKPSPAGTTPVSRGNAAQRLEPGLPQGNELPDPRLTAEEAAVVAAQLEALTDRSGGPDACWPWIGRRVTRGYGGIRLRRPGGVFIYLRACRLVLSAKLRRRLRRREVTRHKCDNPICVNPAHLEPGSDADNAADKVARGRVPRGSRHANATLTEDSARAIFRLLGPNASSRKCARVGLQFGVSHATAYAISRGLTWNHVTGLPRVSRTTPRSRRLCGSCGRIGHNLRTCSAGIKACVDDRSIDEFLADFEQAVSP